MANPSARPLSRQWLSKTLAGVLGGLVLALGCSSLFASCAEAVAPPIRAQLTMWVVTPIWLAALGGCFVFQSGRRAWLWLGTSNLVVVSVALAMRML